MYLDSGMKSECYGCEACVQVCTRFALSMQEDDEGFRYPVIDTSLCVNCGKCRMVCPFAHPPEKHAPCYAFGGYHLDPAIRFESTSGGAFSAIVDAFCDENYVIFGAVAKGLFVFHDYVTDKAKIGKFRKSKYSQSIIGFSYRQARKFLLLGKKVLFSGTPCQIAALKTSLKNIPQEKLLTVEVVCEGLPSPLYVRKLEEQLKKRYGASIDSLDYRYTGKSLLCAGRWDFQMEKIYIWGGVLQKGKAERTHSQREMGF